MFKVLVFILLIFSFNVSAQIISIKLLGENNFYLMSDLKELQTQVKEDLSSNGIPALTTKSFSPHFGLQLQLIIPATFLKTFETKVGLLIDYSSTRGKLSYTDNSTEMSFDQTLQFVSLGFLLEFEQKISNLFSFTYGFKVPFIWGFLNNHFNNLLDVYDNIVNLNLNCITIGIEPNISLLFAESKFIYGINLGYLVCSPEKYSMFNNDKAYLQKRNGDAVTVGTNGFRTALTIGFNL